MANYLMELFGTTWDGMNAGLDDYGLTLEVLEWLRDRNPIFGEFRIYTDEDPGKEWIEWLYENVKVTKKAILRIGHQKNLDFDRAFEIEKLEISTPVKLQNLMKMNSKIVKLTGKLSNKDLNQFFKSWIGGSHEKLKTLKIYHHVNWENLTEGIDVFEKKSFTRKIRRFHSSTSEVFIRNHDGKKAVLKRMLTMEGPRLVFSIL